MRRAQPEGRNAQAVQVVQLALDTLEVTNAVAVGVGKAVDVVPSKLAGAGTRDAQLEPDCVMLTGVLKLPEAKFTVPVRASPSLGATDTLTEPFPLPEVVFSLIQSADAVAVQLPEAFTCRNLVAVSDSVNESETGLTVTSDVGSTGVSLLPQATSTIAAASIQRYFFIKLVLSTKKYNFALSYKE